MDRKRKAVFLRLFENSRKRRKAADEEIDRMIESLEDSDDDKYQEEDEDTMIGAISYASILASTKLTFSSYFLHPLDRGIGALI